MCFYPVRKTSFSKAFFSSFIIFSYTQPAFVFHLQGDFGIVYAHIVAFLFFSMERFYDLSRAFFCNLSLSSWQYLANESLGVFRYVQENITKSF